jgi:hypothetical protein
MDLVTRHTPIAANTMKLDERGMWVSIFDHEALERKYSDLEERLAKRGELAYEGSFPLAFLTVGEHVRAAADESGDCEIVNPRVGSVFRVRLGQIVIRLDDGSLAAKEAC